MSVEIYESIFKAYDVRGVYPREINEPTVNAIGRACASMFGDGKVIIGYDGRHGSPELAKAIEEGLLEEMTELKKKFDVERIGLCTTPMFYFLVHELGATGGMMITASHNPKDYNGVKVVGQGAHAISGTEIEAALKKLLS
jgi:phosphomannomutase